MYCLNFPKYFHGYVALPVSATLILNLVKRETSHWTETSALKFESLTTAWSFPCHSTIRHLIDLHLCTHVAKLPLAALGLSKSFLLVSFYRLPLHMEPWMWPSFCSQGPDLQHQFLLTSVQSFTFILPESWTHIKNVLLASQLLYKLTASHRYHAAHICDPQRKHASFTMFFIICRKNLSDDSKSSCFGAQLETAVSFLLLEALGSNVQMTREVVVKSSKCITGRKKNSLFLKVK